MPLISLLITLIVIGVLLWLVNAIPMDAKIKQVINAVVILFVVLWLISLFVPLDSGPWIGRHHG